MANIKRNQVKSDNGRSLILFIAFFWCCTWCHWQNLYTFMLHVGTWDMGQFAINLHGHIWYTETEDRIPCSMFGSVQSMMILSPNKNHIIITHNISLSQKRQFQLNRQWKIHDSDSSDDKKSIWILHFKIQWVANECLETGA